MERNLMVAGFGGQGVMTLGKFLADATCNSTDKNVTFFYTLLYIPHNSLCRSGAHDGAPRCGLYRPKRKRFGR